MRDSCVEVAWLVGRWVGMNGGGRDVFMDLPSVYTHSHGRLKITRITLWFSKETDIIQSFSTRYSI